MVHTWHNENEEMLLSLCSIVVTALPGYLTYFLSKNQTKHTIIIKYVIQELLPVETKPDCSGTEKPYHNQSPLCLAVLTLEATPKSGKEMGRGIENPSWGGGQPKRATQHPVKPNATRLHVILSHFIWKT